MRRIESANSNPPPFDGREGTILVTGILTATAGLVFLCNVAVTAITSWAMIGLILLAGGALQFYAGLQVTGQRRWHIRLPVLGFYCVFGILCFIRPSPRLALLSLAFFMGLMGIGLARAYCSLYLRRVGGWYWLLASGLFTFCIAAYLAAHWPANGRSLAGMLLATDLMVQGATLVTFAFRLGTGNCDKST